MNNYDIINEILEGGCDESLQDISDALRERFRVIRDRKARNNMRVLKVGDIVRINDNIKPRYMAGHLGKVVSKRQTKIVVKFEHPLGRFGSQVIVPATCVSIYEG